jgi:octaprenyl-diphosphate synthase
MRLSEIYQPINEDLEAVRSEIEAEARSIRGALELGKDSAEYAVGVVSHLFANRGKLLRPALVILSWRLLGDESREAGPEIVSLATAVEFLHMASLAHDDVIDHGAFRRQDVTVNAKYGNYIAVLAGDVLYAKFFSLLTRLAAGRADGDMGLFSIFCDLTEKMCLAEICEQRLMEAAAFADSGEYLTILQYKTADFMAACCEGAAILSGASSEARAGLSSFGRAFGMAFQLYDDLRDEDALVRGAMDLRAEANAFVELAERALLSFPGNEARTILSELCRFIAQEEVPT